MSPAGTTRLRLSSLLVAFALIAGSLLLVQHRAEAAPRAAVAGAVAAPAAAAQIDISALVCPILLRIRSAFAGSAFFSFIQPIFTQLLVRFGCQPSG